MVRKVEAILSSDTFKYIYQTMVLPHFDYCPVVGGICNKTVQEILQKLQNKAARLITGDNYEILSEIVLSKLGWES